MFVPLDKLYDFLRQYLNEDAVIYGFFPHGSKNIGNIKRCFVQSVDEWTWSRFVYTKSVLMHDQEPLDFYGYQDASLEQIKQCIMSHDLPNWNENLCGSGLQDTMLSLAARNKRFPGMFGKNVCDQWMLVHSELRSENLDLYEKNTNAVGIYWWSHAVIAKDWYRYAMVDPVLETLLLQPEFSRDFAIFNRAWSGTREYRLKFTELLVEQGLVDNAHVRFNPISDDGLHYSQHQFKNACFEISRDLDHIEANDAASSSSADYDTQVYQDCAIDIVLETLFDDDRWHLTEKTLRPIACGKPFILMATAGSLQYLRRYGFRTFGDIIDESYDTLSNPMDRMQAVIKSMKEISSLPVDQKTKLYRELHQRARFNRERFWSDEFEDLVITEFQTNYRAANAVCDRHMTGFDWAARRQTLSAVSDTYKRTFVTPDDPIARQEIVDIWKQLRLNRLKT